MEYYEYLFVISNRVFNLSFRFKKRHLTVMLQIPSWSVGSVQKLTLPLMLRATRKGVIVFCGVQKEVQDVQKKI